LDKEKSVVPGERDRFQRVSGRSRIVRKKRAERVVTFGVSCARRPSPG